MELLEGEELTDHVLRQPDRRLPHSHVRVVLEQVFHAIAAAHGAGVVHRDIKPQNVFLARSRLVGVPFVVKVLDFGIAKIVSETAPQSQTTSLGTPGWMAPEQVERGLATPAADVWALGLLSFFVITGTRFWPRGDQENVSIQTLLYEMMLAPIPSASERAGEHGRAHLLPPGFDEWFASCLVRDPASRIPHAGAAWDSLGKVLENWDTASTVSAAPPTVALPPTTQRLWGKGQTQVAGSSPATAPGLNSASVLTSQGGWAPRTVPSGAPPAMQAPRSSSSKLVLIGSGLFLAGVITALAIALWARKDDPPKTHVASIPSQALPSTSTPARPEVSTVSLPAAAFVLDEEKVHVGDIVMDRTEVTVEQWQVCVNAGACDQNVETVSIAGAESWSVLCNWPRRAERPKHPINCVTRGQAEGYCRSVGKRLPTEEEWFRAAYVSSGRVRKFSWGNEAPRPGTVNFCGHDCAALLLAKRLVDRKEPMVQSSDGYPDTAPAGAVDGDQTPDGLLDMGGNVMEWTATTKDDQARCLGGHWLVDQLEDASSGKVYAFDPTDRLVNLGFRCVRTGEALRGNGTLARWGLRICSLVVWMRRRMGSLQRFFALLAVLIGVGCTQIAGYDGYVFDRCGPLETYYNGICVATMVQVSPTFAMDATEVTRSQYEAWLDTEPRPSNDPLCTWNSSLTPKYGWPPGDKGSHPVVGVDWCDAWEYCNAVGKRLCKGEFDKPGDTEWAKTCSSSGASGYSAWCHTGPGTVPVASKSGCQGSAEPYAGIFDLIGNVGEWEMPCESGATGTSQKLCHVRGSYDGPTGCDQTLELAREEKNNYVGFRCCWSPPST